jgi:hypothetical protein
MHIGEVIVQGRVQTQHRRLCSQALDGIRILLASSDFQASELDSLNRVRTSTLLTRKHAGSSDASEQEYAREMHYIVVVICSEYRYTI